MTELPTRNPLAITDRILSQVLAERVRQDDQHGRQDYPSIDTRDIDIATRHYNAGRADIWRQVNAERATPTTGGRCRTCPGREAGDHTHTAWDGLLLEHAYAALGEDHPIRERHRLVQLAALAVAAVEALDRREAAAAAAYVPAGAYVRDDGVECCAHTTPVGAGSCEHCWDLVRWDVLAGGES